MNREPTSDGGVRLRLLAAVVALCAGIAALVVAILLVKGVLA
jgi:uncharacterized membrane protein